MKLLLAFILTAAAAWSGYWFLGVQGAKSGFEAWFDQQRSLGWVAGYSDFQIRGFPNRFDAGFTDISLADPDTGVVWTAPYFEVLALSYKPNHIIAVWPDSQRITTPVDTFNLTSADMRASFKFQANTQLALDSAVLTAAKLVVTPVGRRGESTAIEALTFAVERSGDSPALYRLGLSADGLSPPDQWKEFAGPNRTLPDAFGMLSADVTVEFDKPWDRAVFEGARPQPRHISIRQAVVRWGRLYLQLTGELDIGPSGLLTGEVTISVRNWRDILGFLTAAGALPDAMAGSVEEALGLITSLAEDPATLKFPLDFRQGQAFLGPVPLGPAPIVKLR